MSVLACWDYLQIDFNWQFSYFFNLQTRNHAVDTITLFAADMQFMPETIDSILGSDCIYTPHRLWISMSATPANLADEVHGFPCRHAPIDGNQARQMEVRLDHHVASIPGIESHRSGGK